MRKSNIIAAVKYAYYYAIAHIILLFKYEKKYIKGKHFTGPHHNMVAPGWKLIIDDARGCRKLRVNRSIPWPCSPFVTVGDEATVDFHPDDLNNFQSKDVYYQTYGTIKIGKAMEKQSEKMGGSTV